MLDDEDDALSWAGDEPTTVAPPAAPPVQRTTYVETTPDAKPQMPAALLITYGILAGAYLIYTIGWVVSVQRYNASFVTSSEPLNAVMFGLGQLLAIAAPALWFGAAVLLTRGRRAIIRLLVLLVGLAVVVPWPFVLGVWQ